MEFNSQICTTKEQSERLLALGLKRETSDMCIRIDLANPIAIPYNEVDEFYYKIVIPAWSLDRLIEILDIWYLDLNFNEFANTYEQVISCFEERVKGGFINKKYLNE